jgi:hypothetical protein
MNPFKLTAGYPAPPGAISSYYSLDLFVQISGNNITMAILNSATIQLISLFEFSCPVKITEDEYYLELKKFFDEEEIFNKPFRRSLISIEYPFSTLVPSDIFDENKMADYLSISFDLPSGQVFINDEIVASGIRNVYCLPEDLFSIILTRFSSEDIHHFTTPLLSGTSNEAGNNPEGNVVFCHIRQNIFDLIIFRSAKLLYHNSFNFSNKEEFVYYILFVFEQLDIQPLKERVTLLGEVKEDSELIRFSREFLGRLTIPTSLFENHEVIATGKPELLKYFNLFSLSSCG